MMLLYMKSHHLFLAFCVFQVDRHEETVQEMQTDHKETVTSLEKRISEVCVYKISRVLMEESIVCIMRIMS